MHTPTKKAKGHPLGALFTSRILRLLQQLLADAKYLGGDALALLFGDRFIYRISECDTHDAHYSDGDAYKKREHSRQKRAEICHHEAHSASHQYTAESADDQGHRSSLFRNARIKSAKALDAALVSSRAILDVFFSYSLYLLLLSCRVAVGKSVFTLILVHYSSLSFSRAAY